MKLSILLLLMSAASTYTAPKFETIGDVLQRHEESQSDTLELFIHFVDGFRVGHTYSYRRQKTLAYEWGTETEYGDKDDDFIRCVMFETNYASIYSRLLKDAKESPDERVFIWISADFGEQCGDKMEAAIRDQYE